MPLCINNWSKLLFERKNKITLIFILIGIVILLALNANKDGTFTQKPNLESIKECVINPTGKDFNTTSYKCIKDTVAKLLKIYSTQNIILYLEATSSPEEIRDDCHEIAHEVGRQTFQKNKEIEKALLECSNHCKSGCTHGVIVEAVKHELGIETDTEDIAHADASEIKKIGNKYCYISRALCHAIGHIIFINTSDLHKSLVLCEQIISWNKSKEGCYRGVFMESYGGRDSFSMLKFDATDNTHIEQCKSIPEPYTHSCYIYGFVFSQEYYVSMSQKNSFEKTNNLIISDCLNLSYLNSIYCFEGFGTYVYKSLIKNKEVSTKPIKTCSLIKDPTFQYACIFGTISFPDNFEIEKRLTYCESLNSSENISQCKNILYKLDPI